MVNWVFCTNCGWEWDIKELKLYYDENNNAVRCYCPNCNWNEFTKDSSEEDEELIRIMEDGDYEIYPLPGKMIYEEA